MVEDTKKWLYYAIPIAVVIVLGAVLYFGRARQTPEPETQSATTTSAEAPPAVQHPITPSASEAELPPIESSDQPLLESLNEVFGRNLTPHLVTQDIVRNVVVTIDNLPRKKTAVQRWPLKPTAGALATTGAEDVMLSEENFARYEPLVQLIKRADAAQLTTLYRRYYPLFQQAYVDLGYPDGYFNDRLVEVIDHLLAAPEVAGPIRLTQPGVFFEYADPSLEERSAGQKLLIRMGPQNAAAVKAKLREMRAAVASQARPEAG